MTSPEPLGLGSETAFPTLKPKSAAAFGEITKLLKANLTDLHAYKVGPKDTETGKLAVDVGLYAQVLIGRTTDGKVAGVFMGDVET